MELRESLAQNDNIYDEISLGHNDFFAAFAPRQGFWQSREGAEANGATTSSERPPRAFEGMPGFRPRSGLCPQAPMACGASSKPL